MTDYFPFAKTMVSLSPFLDALEVEDGNLVHSDNPAMVEENLVLIGPTKVDLTAADNKKPGPILHR